MQGYLCFILTQQVAQENFIPLAIGGKIQFQYVVSTKIRTPMLYLKVQTILIINIDFLLKKKKEALLVMLMQHQCLMSIFLKVHWDFLTSSY